MSNNSILGPTLKEILNVIYPLREDLDTRIGIINELRSVVQSVESLRGAIVEPFGSFVSNLFTRWGDLDISIELLNGSHISSLGKTRKQTLLGDLLKALRKRGGLRRFQFIQNARVPILKFESSRQNISCDISMDNMVGLMKSRLLLWINAIDERFRDMVLLVKEWAKAHDVNNPKTGSFNSYSLSLLVIFHFQTCVPAILPPLRDIYPGNLVDDLKGVRATAERNIAETCAANIARFRSENRTNNRSSLSKLFVSFVAKFSDLHLKAPELGISPFTGRWEHIGSITRWLPNNHAIFIEDPFEQPENSARAVSVMQLARISEAFMMTHHRLITPNQNKHSILTTLTRQQTLQFIVGPPVRYPNYNGQHHRNRSQVHQAMHSPARVQHHQSPSVRSESSRPNRFFVQPVEQSVEQSVQQPGQQFHSQIGRQQHSNARRLWRPKHDR
ncbi:hypothetical protein Dsin_003500 [Dipteronia sinensis]|uniref:Poly(A) RNA polymerase mitochondrial-like central palm domain-containing protein n=1 Tax=Dipteronia sinensis TaxID=43782 RepID=A0AAE0B9M0_9ROSI|nr:hypothetical protein Dsin_003500 [Dipteronia sinensis]